MKGGRAFLDLDSRKVYGTKAHWARLTRGIYFAVRQLDLVELLTCLQKDFIPNMRNKESLNREVNHIGKFVIQ